ncbi:peptidase S9 [Haloprofundus marisrubri]|uniref:Acyl-peptide hydrolase n=1 Tax=Haloprofundus marisrubri TaxID=1514971 RepID=A0A0W1RAS8_9EURY|nr:S9 family peptidase [Haloprofundus marisrubri]KTG10655.1 peptidase S9 [Haloprofundus marisrubri]
MPQYAVARYLGIDAARQPAFSQRGDSLTFIRDTTGTPQIWTLDEAGAPPTRLTAFEERISVIDWSPTRDEFVFGMDRGSDERDQLFRYDADDGTIHGLTERPDAIHGWGGWSPDGDFFAFTSNRRDAQAFDVYVQARDGDPDDADLVLESDGWLEVLGWSPDGESLALREAHASFDQDLSILDLDSAEARVVTPDGEASYDCVAFGPDGDALYLVTNYESDTSYLGRLDLESREIATVTSGGDWNVEEFVFDCDSRTLVYGRNVDGYSELYAGELVDETRVDVDAVDLPRGVVSNVTLGPQGEQFAFTFSKNTEPFGVYVGELATGDGSDRSDDEGATSADPTRWTPLDTVGIPQSTFRDAETIRYESFDDRAIPAYWTLPEDAEAGETPVIVDIHGGPEHQRRPWFYPTKQFFLNEGYAVLEPNVRGSSGYGKAYTHLDDVEKRMDSVKDVKAAVDWLYEQDEVDSDRIVAYGRSYGGFMVLAAITEYPDIWAAAVEFVGIADFETFLENTGEWRRDHRSAEYGSLDDRELLKSISPIHNVDRIQCPLFVQHGANDPRVPVGETEQIVDRVRERGVPVEKLVFEDEGHHTTTRSNLVEEFERIRAFLDDHV